MIIPRLPAPRMQQRGDVIEIRWKLIRQIALAPLMGLLLIPISREEPLKWKIISIITGNA